MSNQKTTIEFKGMYCPEKFETKLEEINGDYFCPSSERRNFSNELLEKCKDCHYISDLSKTTIKKIHRLTKSYYQKV